MFLTALVRHLRRNDCYLLREGSAHSIWVNRATGAQDSVPRHSEIKDWLARKICRTLSIPEIGRGGR